MTELASPAQIALTTVAVGWPLAACVALLVWSGLRRGRPSEDESTARSRLASVIEALDADEDLDARLRARQRNRAAAMPQH